jgi:dephospho-CoA kinase
MFTGGRESPVGVGPLRIGLTGGIASGKSVVLRRLAQAGFATLDLDSVTRDLMTPGGTAFVPIVSAFGEGVLAADGTIDRKRLGDRVFADPNDRRRLEAIVHPLVRREEERRTALLGEDAIVVVDGALLVEAGLHLRFARLVVVHCDRSTQLARLMERDRIDERAARRRLEAQLPPEQKRRFAHFTIDSRASLEQTERAADALGLELRAFSATHPRVSRRLSLSQGLAALQYGSAVGPRGLDPASFLEVLTGDLKIDMQSLARKLDPPALGTWYGSAREREERVPECLAAALVLWTASWPDGDAEWLASAAASIARLTHREDGDVAGACFTALAMLEAVKCGRREGDTWRPSEDTWELARHWGGSAPDSALERALVIGFRMARDPQGARREALRSGADPDTAGALAGLVGGRAVTPWPPRLESCLAPWTTARGGEVGQASAGDT